MRTANLVTRSGTVALGRATSTYPGDSPRLIVYEMSKPTMAQTTSARAALRR